MKIPHEGSREQAVALALLREGLVTQSEAAALTGASKQLVRHWCLRRGIDTGAAREACLRKTWQRALRQ
jgi:hypothetical protein